jgi:hypothetical protein
MPGSPASQRGGTPAALLALTAALAGCGAHTPTPTSAVRPGPPVRTPKVFVSSPGTHELVWLHLYNYKSLMWQTIFVRRDGSGELTSLIGEIAGAPQRAFRLPAGQLGALRRLVDAARAPSAGTSTAPLQDGYVFSLHIAGRPSENDGGRAPRPVAELIDFLSGLAFSYCC